MNMPRKIPKMTDTIKGTQNNSITSSLSSIQNLKNVNSPMNTANSDTKKMDVAKLAKINENKKPSLFSSLFGSKKKEVVSANEKSNTATLNPIIKASNLPVDKKPTDNAKPLLPLSVFDPNVKVNSTERGLVDLSNKNILNKQEVKKDLSKMSTKELNKFARDLGSSKFKANKMFFIGAVASGFVCSLIMIPLFVPLQSVNVNQSSSETSKSEVNDSRLPNGIVGAPIPPIGGVGDPSDDDSSK